MRFFAVHDPSGNILNLVGSPSTGPVMRPIQTAANELFSEIKLPPRLFDAADAKSYTNLAEVPATYVIEMPLRTPARLVKKGPGPVEGQGRLESLNITPNPVSRGTVPRFDVTLKAPTDTDVHVTITLRLPLGLNMPLGSVLIPAGQTTMALSAPIPAGVFPGAHTVAALSSANDTVTAVLNLSG